jgi:hypothetical protein
MALAPEVIDGPVRDWLAAQRTGLNGRFRLAQRRFPQLDAAVVLALCRELLPGLAGDGEAGSVELFSSVYDLILLHAGRGILAPAGGDSSALGVLLRETFPRLRRLLLARPQYMPAALSNAVENLGARGIELARGLATVADDLADGNALLDAGALLAWRLGESRLRQQALTRAGQLPPRVVRVALGIDCPDEAVPGLLAGLAADGWCRPEDLLTPPRPAKAETAWSLSARLGNFRGFDGHFLRPPLLLDPGARASRHRFWVRSETATYRLDADVFGWVCRPDPSVDLPVRAPKGKKDRPAPLPAAITSYVEAENLLAFTLAESFRVRILTPPRRPQ